MERYIGGERDHWTLFPEHREDWVGEDSAVRAIDSSLDAPPALRRSGPVPPGEMAERGAL